jgi:hypothetical protein
MGMKLTYCNDFAIYVFKPTGSSPDSHPQNTDFGNFPNQSSMYLPLSASSEIPIKINAFLDIGYNFIFNGLRMRKLFEGQFSFYYLEADLIY